MAGQLLDHRGRIIASDVLPMDALPDVTFIQDEGTEIYIIEGVLVEPGTYSAFVRGGQVFDDGSFCRWGCAW